jgi:chromosomal replication initiator protein
MNVHIDPLLTALRRETKPSQKFWFHIVEQSKRLVTVAEIQDVVATYYGLTRHDILSDRRTAEEVKARHVAMYLAKTLTHKSLPNIGNLFNKRDHTTVLHAVEKMKRLLETDRKLAKDVATLEGKLQ